MEEHKVTIDELKVNTAELLGFATAENQARTTEILTAITEEFAKMEQSATTSQNEIENLRKNNETLRDVNAKLFLKVGNPGGSSEDKPEQAEEPQTPKLSYDALFKDGELL